MAVFDVYDTQCMVFVPNCLENFPKMTAFIQACNELPRIAAYKASDAFAGLMKFGALPQKTEAEKAEEHAKKIAAEAEQ